MAFWDLQFLSNANVVTSVPAGARRKFLDYLVPTGKFWALDHTKPFFARPAVYEIQAVTGPASGSTKNVTLAYPIARPPAAYQANVDLVCKAYADTDDDGVFETKLGVAIASYENGIITLTLTSGWDDEVTHNVRLSWTPAVGHMELCRELGSGASVQIPRKVAEFAFHDLNSADLIENPIYFGRYYWLVEGCRFTGYVSLPEVAGHTVYLDTDVTLGVGQFSLHVLLADLDTAELLYRKWALQKVPNLYVAYPTLYKLLVATLAGLVPEVDAPAVVASE